MPLAKTLEFITDHPLNRRQKTRAMLRFLQWQLGSRLLPGPAVYEWMPGVRVIVRRGETGFTGNLYCGLHDFEEMAYLLHVLNSDDLFVDIGANIGSYTLLASGVKGARSYCFEPAPSTYKRLMDNLAINHLSSRVVAMNIGLSSGEEMLRFTTGGETCINHVIANDEESATAITVPVRALDSVLCDEAPAFLKIDVEGFETAVLRGATKTLARPSLHSIVMELNGSGRRYGFDEETTLAALREFGFRPYKYEPFGRKLIPLGTGKNMSSGNTLFLRNEDEIRRKIAAAPPVLIHAQAF
ncbi:MAG: FkbM family methyltransferase [Terracidiphilus sp.]